MRRFLLAIALVGLAAPAMAAEFHEGTYNVQGTNLNGSAYSGTAEVKVLSSTTCAITWTTGTTSSQGPCMRAGDVVTAAYVQGNDIGLVMYQLKDDGSLEGVWTITGQDGNGTENLTPQ
jgi:hypothetical protein